MDKKEFRERWEAIFNSSPNGCQLFAKLFYKKPLETNETRLERHRKQKIIYKRKNLQKHKERCRKYYYKHKTKKGI